MNVTFDADPMAGKMFEAYSLDCIDFAKANFDLELDVSEQSVQTIELMAGMLHDSMPPAGPPEEILAQFEKALGSHIAHVLVVVKGWVPGSATFDGGQIPAVELPGKNMCWPWGKVHNRLINGAEDNLWHYYLSVTDQLGPPVTDLSELFGTSES